MAEDPQRPEGEEPEDGGPTGEDHPGPEIEGIEELAHAVEGAPAAPEDAGADDAPPAGEAPAEEPSAAEEPPAEEPPPAAGEPPAAEEAPAAEESADASAAEPARAERPRPGARRKPAEEGDPEEVIPGAHLEPDLVLEEQRSTEGEYSEYTQYAEGEGPPAEGAEQAPGAEGAPEAAAEQPTAATPLDLAADARYRATGKRKSAVARVILRPGEGTYTINGRHLDEYFPRVRLQRMARQPLEATGNQSRMDVVARIHGGGVSAQATALRHGIARALEDADPALRGELKRRGYLTRDPRVKERKKAGLKKARKRPQFSKR